MTTRSPIRTGWKTCAPPQSVTIARWSAARRFRCSDRPRRGPGVRTRFFTPHYLTTGPVSVLYSSGNLLVRSDVLKTMPQPYLDPVFNFTGGGDSDFIRRSLAEGFSAAWCGEAAVRETVPDTRVTWRWIQARSLRNGALSAVIEHRQRADERFGGAATIARSLALLAISPIRFIAGCARSRSLLGALYPVHVALGRIMSEFGYANEQYRNPD